MSGNVTVKPVSAKLTRDTDFFSKMDPYVKLKFNGQEFKSKVVSGGGKNPNWTDVFNFRKGGSDSDLLKIEVWDSDSVSADDLIGEGAFTLSKVAKGGSTTEWVNISYQGKGAG